VHPNYKMVTEGAPLPAALTPVYPAGEGLSQTILRKTIVDAMARIEWRDTLSDKLRDELDLMPFEPAVRMLHNPPPDIDESALADRSHAAWVRMKFDELLAQQLSMKRAQMARRAKGAAVLPNDRQAVQGFPQATTVFTDSRAAARTGRNPRRPQAILSHAAFVARGCWQWQNRGRSARCSTSDRQWFPDSADGTDGNPG